MSASLSIKLDVIAGTHAKHAASALSRIAAQLWVIADGQRADGQRATRIVLTIAHLDHTPENCADDNLQALCQRCHLRHDHELHQRNAAATRRSRKAAGDLFEGAP